MLPTALSVAFSRYGKRGKNVRRKASTGNSFRGPLEQKGTRLSRKRVSNVTLLATLVRGACDQKTEAGEWGKKELKGPALRQRLTEMVCQGKKGSYKRNQSGRVPGRSGTGTALGVEKR